MDGLCQSNEEAFRKYQENTTRNLTKALLELRPNLVLHTQMVVGPLTLSQFDFNFFHDIFIEYLSFNGYHPQGKDWEDFQMKQKQTVCFFFHNTPKVENEEENLEGFIDLEKAPNDYPQAEEAHIKPTDHHAKEGN